MPDILVKSLDLGFDANIRDATELPRGSADDGSQNVLYSRGTIKTPFGFGVLNPALDNAVLGLGTYTELNKSQHFLAVTRSSIYQRDNENETWDNITQSGQELGGNQNNPVSFASILHTDGIALNGSGADAFHHSLVSTGTSPIQRWAGDLEDDYADLLGADGYNAIGSGVETHQALQAAAFFNRALLVSAMEANANGVLISNNQRIRWPQAGKLEVWDGTGSGFVDLLDTGGYNVWGALLGAQWIQYQNNSIWSLTHVGGTTVFTPDIEMPDLGLLAPHLLHSKNNVHYFVGNDFNVYAYNGGSNITKISKNIDRYLRRDLDPAFASRSWLQMGAENSRLWLFIVPNGQQFITQAYAIDMITGNWMKRDFTHKWPDSVSGITSVGLVGSSSFNAGRSYNEILHENARAPISIPATGCDRVSNVVTVTSVDEQDFVANNHVTITGITSDGNTEFNGTFPILTVADTTHFTYAQTGDDETSETTIGTATVAISYQDAVDADTTYRQEIQETLTTERLVLGDSNGFVYQYDEDLTCDDTVSIPSRHMTEVYDLGRPNDNKIWPGFIVTAKSSGPKDIIISYRVGDFNTTESGWIDFGVLSLTTEFNDFEIFINDTSKRVQFMFSNITGTSDIPITSGNDFQISNYALMGPALEGRI